MPRFEIQPLSHKHDVLLPNESEIATAKEANVAMDAMIERLKLHGRSIGEASWVVATFIAKGGDRLVTNARGEHVESTIAYIASATGLSKDYLRKLRTHGQVKRHLEAEGILKQMLTTGDGQPYVGEYTLRSLGRLLGSPDLLIEAATAAVEQASQANRRLTGKTTDLAVKAIEDRDTTRSPDEPNDQRDTRVSRPKAPSGPITAKTVAKPTETEISEAIVAGLQSCLTECENHGLPPDVIDPLRQADERARLWLATSRVAS